MPIYEYRCENGHTFETLQRMSDDPLTTCETCGAPAARVLHAPAVHFKGSGFYNTDYGKGGKSKSAGGAGGGSKKSGSDSNGSSGSSDTSSSSSSDSGSSSKKPESKPGSSSKSD